MTPAVSEDIPSLIRTRLKPRFAAWRSCNSLAELKRRADYQEVAADVERVLETVETGGFGPRHPPAKPAYRVLAWNIERGKELAGQLELLRTHPWMREADVLLLTETDVGMARSGNLDIAQTMARELGYHYAFVPCYLSLVKGSGVERDIEGENDLGLHGNAILSRYPIREPRAIHLANGIDKMASREKRLGRQTTLAARIAFPNLDLPVACVHLDAQSTQRHRADQMRSVVDAFPPGSPLLIGGDWNTTTFDSSTAFRAICGYFLRVAMGPGRVIRNHFLHPDRWFERRLFGLLRERGFEYNRSNVPRGHTIFYHVDDLGAFGSLAEWVPLWCFDFIRWALREHGGGCPLKIDWFASRGLDVRNPAVFNGVHEGFPRKLSDHDPIGVEVAAAAAFRGASSAPRPYSAG